MSRRPDPLFPTRTGRLRWGARAGFWEDTTTLWYILKRLWCKIVHRWSWWKVERFMPTTNYTEFCFECTKCGEFHRHVEVHDGG